MSHNGEWISEAVSPEEERLRLMADGDNQWDLSENDRNAISWVLGALRHRTERMNTFHRSVNAAAAEIHMAEVQRDEARASAKGIILDLISELSAEQLKCWLCGPNQFKLAVIARLDNWR